MIRIFLEPAHESINYSLKSVELLLIAEKNELGNVAIDVKYLLLMENDGIHVIHSLFLKFLCNSFCLHRINNFYFESIVILRVGEIVMENKMGNAFTARNYLRLCASDILILVEGEKFEADACFLCCV